MLEIGKIASFSKTISESDVYMFAGISGDFNSLHINEIEAKKTIFKKRIAHGILVTSFISKVIATSLPGEGTIYLEQQVKFQKPVFIGDTVTATVAVEKILNSDKKIIQLKTYVKNQFNEIVIDGYAIVKSK
ncbi:MaoC family dehydratase [Fusobacterium sp. PH5-44]|uniref:MaoC family dehydratase n=1 Tax=unclassified Fusobacterium TaxID=2648384 RepID=UPI003D2272EF